MATFKAANKKQQKLRLAITGLAGSGKTYSALRIASGMGSKIAVIDSEHSSSELYANKFKFDICALNTFEVEEYVEAIESAGGSGYDVIIIDSLSHAWEKLVKRVDRIADQRYKGNTFRAWEEGGELQNKLVESILSSPCHIIGTIRTKVEYAVDSESGKTKITKLGTAPKQRDGFEYELSLVMELSQKHVGFISKDRTGKFQDKYIELPGEGFGQELIAWLNEGAVDTGLQVQSLLREIGNILKSADESGMPFFTDKEIDLIRDECRKSASLAIDQRIEFLENILDVHKSIIHKRVFQEAEPPKPAAPVVPDKPVATQTTTAQTQPVPAKPTAGNQERSIKADFEKMMHEKNRQPETTLVASMYSEREESFDPDYDPEYGPDDEFQDDIPVEERKPETGFDDGIF
jgi:hypothetical protein